MPQQHVGSLLRSRREQLRIPLQKAALDTNIRERVLEAIESNDFKNYPPKGHARGMISSYARYLGLDPHPVLRQLEDDLARFESSSEMASSADRTRRGVGRYGERVNAEDKPLPRGASRQGGQQRRMRRRRASGEAPDSKLSESLQHELAAEQDDRYKSGTVKVVGTRQTGSFGKVGSPRGSAGSVRARSGAPSRASSQPRADQPARRSAPSRDDGPYHAPTRAGRASMRSRASSRPAASASPSKSGTIEVDGEELSFFSTGDTGKKTARRKSHDRRMANAKKAAEAEPKNIFDRALRALKAIFSERRTRAIAIALIAIVVLIAIAAGVLISTAGSSNSGVIEVQGGVQDTTTTTKDSSTATATVTTTNGNPINIKIEVGEGKTSLINVTYDDDNAYSGTAVGPWSREFLVTSSLSATFGTPDAVTVTENGKEVEVSKNDDGTGSLDLTIQTTSSNTVNSADSSN